MVISSPSEILAALLICDRVKLHDENNDFASLLTPHEASVITRHGLITAHTYKGTLCHVRMKRGIPVNTAMRRLAPLQVEASRHITKRRQGNGAKNWVPHYEKSEGGQVGMNTTLTSHLSFVAPFRRYMIGKIPAPLAQSA